MKHFLQIIFPALLLTLFSSCDNENVEYFQTYAADIWIQTADGGNPVDSLYYDPVFDEIHGLSYNCDIFDKEYSKDVLELARSTEDKLYLQFLFDTSSFQRDRFAEISYLSLESSKMFGDNERHLLTMYWDKRTPESWIHYSEYCVGATFDGRECRVEHTDSTNRIIVTLPKGE